MAIYLLAIILFILLVYGNIRYKHFLKQFNQNQLVKQSWKVSMIGQNSKGIFQCSGNSFLVQLIESCIQKCYCQRNLLKYL